MAQWSAGEPVPYDEVIGILWPGYELNGTKFGFGSVFLRANPHARRSGKKISNLLLKMADQANSLDVLTHSMGTSNPTAMLPGPEGTDTRNLLNAVK